MFQKYLVHVSFGNVEYAAQRTVDDAGVAVHDVELAVPGDGGVHQIADVFLLGDVAVHVANVLAEFIGDFLARFVLDIGDHHFRSVFMKNANCASSDPACPAGDNRHLPFQSEKPPN